MEPIQRSFQGLGPAGFHRTIYWEWGSVGTGPTTIAVHGLTRNGRDFDALAAALSGSRRVVCPDIAGRGQSDWLPQGALYNYPQYLADCALLIARLDVTMVDWIGTSMGGLIGLMLAAQPGSPIRRLVLNDVGPFVPKAALERIGSYVGGDPRFATEAELAAYIRRTYAAFGPLTDDGWAQLARYSARALPDGGFALAYDPKIAEIFQGPIADVDLWPLWDGVSCPVLVLRGGKSDLLTADIAAEMARRKPTARIVEFPECGHAPALIEAHQVQTVAGWLEAP